MKIKPSVAPRLWFHALNADRTPVTGLLVAGITSAKYVTINGGVRSAEVTITLGAKVADTAALVTGQLVTINAADGWYGIDAPAGAALSTADYAELVIVLVDATRLVYPTRHPIDAAVASVPALVRTNLTTELARIDAAISSRNATTPPTVGEIADAVDAALLNEGDATNLIAAIVARIDNTNVDETTFVAALKSALFDAGSIGNKLTVNAAGQVESSNMRGTDNAMLASGYTAPLSDLETQAAAAAALAVYNPPTRTEATADKDEVIDALAAIDSGGDAGASDIAREVAGLLAGTTIIVQSPIFSGDVGQDLDVEQGDDYSNVPTRIEIESAADLTGLHFVLASRLTAGGSGGMTLRMLIRSDVTGQYALFAPTSEQTELWTAGAWELRHRIEISPNKFRTIKRGRLIVRPFDTPANVIEVDPA